MPQMAAFKFWGFGPPSMLHCCCDSAVDGVTTSRAEQPKIHGSIPGTGDFSFLRSTQGDSGAVVTGWTTQDTWLDSRHGRFFFPPEHPGRLWGRSHGLNNVARFQAREIFLSSGASRQTIGPTQPPILYRLGGRKRSRWEPDHLPPSSSEVTNEWKQTSIPTYAFMACTGATQP
jgi:hypothetical protein